MILLDAVIERAGQERLISALTHQDTWIDPDDEVDAFNKRLERPLNYTRMKELLMKEIAG